MGTAKLPNWVGLFRACTCVDDERNFLFLQLKIFMVVEEKFNQFFITFTAFLRA